MAISDEKYVALTTYKKDGEPKTLPVWIADLGDGTVGFTTASSSYKVKRLRNDPRVQLQPSDSRGTPKEGSETVTGTARIVSGAEFERVQRTIAEKYGMQYKAITMVGRLAKLFRRGSGTDTGVIIDLG